MLSTDYKGMCEKCRNRKWCNEPCAFVVQILVEDNKPPFYEHKAIGQDDQPIIIIKSKNHRYEVNESNLQQDEKQIDDGPDDINTVFTTEADNPFASYSPKLSQTTVFIMRFFERKPYEEIAEALEVSVDTVRSMYRNAKERLITALIFADTRHTTVKRFQSTISRNEKTFGKLPKSQRWYLMYAIFGLTMEEIASLESSTPNQVHHAVKDVSDRLKTGLINWIEASREEVEAAKNRIIAKN